MSTKHVFGISVLACAQCVWAANGDATWKKVEGTGTGGTDWTAWSAAANWTDGEAPDGIAARAYLNAAQGQYVTLPETLTMKLVTSKSGSTLPATLPVLGGDGVFSVYLNGCNECSVEGVYLYAPYKVMVSDGYYAGFSLAETHICAPCVGGSSLTGGTMVGSPRFARTTYFHFDRFATELTTDGTRTVSDWPTHVNWDAEGDAEMRLYAPEGSATNVTSKWVQNAGTAFLKQAAGEAAHTLSVGTRVTGAGIPDDTFLKRVFPDGSIELSAAPTTTAAANALTFAAVTYDVTLDYATRKLILFNQDKVRKLYLQKRRSEDAISAVFKEVELYIVDDSKKGRVKLDTDAGYEPGHFQFDALTWYSNAGRSFELTLGNAHFTPPKTVSRPFDLVQSDADKAATVTVAAGEERPLASAEYPCALQSLKGTVTKDGAGTWTLTATNGTAAAYSGALVVSEGAVMFLNGTMPIAQLTLKAGATLKVAGELDVTGTLVAEKGARVSGGGIRGAFDAALLDNLVFEEGAYALPLTPTEGEADVTAISGGVTRLSQDGDAIFVFDTNTTMRLAAAGTYDILVVGGGGGGGNVWGGGGGAGGVIYRQQVYLTNGIYSVTVGAGGLGAYGRGSNDTAVVGARWNSSGGFSKFMGLKALGGGAGGTYLGDEKKHYREGIQSYKGAPGASGGGGGAMYPQGLRKSPGGAGTEGQGNRGADGFIYAPGSNTADWRIAAGSGGGAGAAAVNAYTNASGEICGSVSGDGVMVPIFGEKWYGGGGGGAVMSSAGGTWPGGRGGGGAGAVSLLACDGTDGLACTGGGGGGATPVTRNSTGASAGRGGNGGSGVVILRCAQASPDLKPVPSNPVATGGVFHRRGGYAIHSFTNDGTFALSQDGYVDLLVVGGGGGGGMAAGGGGGGGGVRVYSNVWLKAGSYPVTIGAGGAGAKAYDMTPHEYSYNGGASTFRVTDTEYGKLSAPGGGGGGTRAGYKSTADAKTGASGGGGGAPYYGTSGWYGLGAAAIEGMGFGGGSSTNAGDCADNPGPSDNNTWRSFSGAGGGGGGAGGAGSNGWYDWVLGVNNCAKGGVGGMGLLNDFSGKARYYGVGGSGGSRRAAMDASGYQDNAQTGGARGGGNLAGGQAGEDGFDGTGGGGGGGGAQNDQYGRGGRGGSGIVIVRYRCTPPGMLLILR